MTALSKKTCVLFLFLTLGSFPTFSQEIDLMLKGGTVIDPKNKINQRLDVAIDDGIIVQVGPNLSTKNVFQVVDVTGLYVVPGIIDMHGHHFYGTEPDAYLSNGSSALAPDGYTFRSGVTTVVVVGGSGWRNFKTFKKQTIETSQTRVLSFLNIVGTGMKGGPIEQNLLDMDARLTAMEALAFPDFIVGVKVAHYAGPEWTPVDQAVQAGKLANIPVMIDFGGVEPELSLETLFNEKLRPGDIFTHCYAKVKGRIPLVDEKRKLKPFVLPAQKKGIVFDVGHGGGSFLWDQAIPAIEQGFKPNTISTDLHTGSMNGGMKDQLNVMSKLLNVGLTLDEVIEASTWKPAQVINRPALGHLTVGAGADIAVLKLENGTFGYTDVMGWKVIGNKKLVCELTLRDGKTVWDLNGVSKPVWEK
ncbi:MAG: amidohydrolase/deacetylase family metallohydrolase [Bacteroidota bacterium]